MPTWCSSISSALAEIRNEKQLTKCGWSPWHGATLTGWPVRTWVMGHEVYRDGQFVTDRMRPRSHIRPRPRRLLGDGVKRQLPFHVAVFR